MVEHTSRQGDRVQIMKAVAAGDNIVPAGSEAKRGERLLSPGLRLDYDKDTGAWDLDPRVVARQDVTTSPRTSLGLSLSARLKIVLPSMMPSR